MSGLKKTHRRKILVIGGTRFIGRAVVEALLNAQYKPYLYHRGETKALFSNQIVEIFGDRRQIDQLREKISNVDVDTVINVGNVGTKAVKETSLLILSLGN